MEEKSKDTLKKECATTSDCLVSTDELHEEKVTCKDFTEGSIISYPMDIDHFETLNPESAKSQNILQFDNSPEKLNVLEPDKDASASSENNDSPSNVELFSRFNKNSNPDLHQSVSNDSNTSEEISIESPKESDLSNPATKDASTMTDQLLNVLTTNEAREKICSFYSSLIEQNKDVLEPSVTASRNPSPVSTESRERSKSSEVEKPVKSRLHERSKSSEVEKPVKSRLHERSKSYRIQRKLRSSESDKKSSKSSKEKNSDALLSELLASMEEMQVTEIKIEKKYSCEAAATLIKHGNQVIVRYDTDNEVQYHFGFFKRHEIVSSPIESSDSGTLTPGSDDPESRSSPDPPISIENPSSTTSTLKSSELSDLYEKLKQDKSDRYLFERCPRSNLSEPCMKFKLSKLSDKLKFPDSFKSSKVTNPSVRPEQRDSSLISEGSNPYLRSTPLDPKVRPKQLDPSVRPKQPDRFEEPKQLNLFGISEKLDRFERPEQLDLFGISKQLGRFERPKQLDPSVRPKQLDPSVRPTHLDVKSMQLDPSEVMFPSSLGNFIPKQSGTKLVDSSVETEVDSSRYTFDLTIESFLSLRRPHMLHLRGIAERVKEIMKSIALLKQNEQDNEEIIHVRWKQEDAYDWFKVLLYWDIMIEDINIMLGNINVILELLYPRFLPTIEQFDDFLNHFELVFQEAEELYKICNTGLSKCTRYCSNLDSIRFFIYATSFLADMDFLLKYLHEEVIHIKNIKYILHYHKRWCST